MDHCDAPGGENVFTSVRHLNSGHADPFVANTEVIAQSSRQRRERSDNTDCGNQDVKHHFSFSLECLVARPDVGINRMFVCNKLEAP